MIGVYQVESQPATNWVDSHNQEPIQISWPASTLLWCECCRKQHPASDCVVFSYYDGPMIYCAPDQGCKNPKVVERKKMEKFRNRSTGQKNRWAKVMYRKTLEKS